MNAIRMNKVISTITFLLIATAALAGNKKESESAKTPVNSAKEITFDVNGLSACSGEFETADAVLEFHYVENVQESKNIASKWVLLTESIEDSIILEFID
jgi:hypothetical protein